MNKVTERVVQAASPVEEDRVTVIITGHYQEYDSPTTHLKWAYDRCQPVDQKPLQATQRINPRSRALINLFHLEWGKAEVFLAHEKARISRESEQYDTLKEAQDSNVVLLYSEKGELLGELLPGRACFMRFTGPVYAESTHATAILHVTAFPDT